MAKEDKIIVQEVKTAILEHLATVQGRIAKNATLNDYYQAVSFAVRDLMTQNWMHSLENIINDDKDRVMCYLSAEFLLGPQLGNNLLCINGLQVVEQAVRELGIDFDELLALEPEPGLGNGGLGRLAACYIDSCATLGVPAIGYGIRYEFGIFQQEIVDGWQQEKADKWLRLGFPWEIVRPEAATAVGFGGSVHQSLDDEGRLRTSWQPEQIISGIPCYIVIPAYGSQGVSILRLYKAEAGHEFDFQAFNTGDYYGAVDDKIVSENISKVLYPNDEQLEGKVLRLKQQYFFVRCAIANMFEMLIKYGHGPEIFADAFSVQLNDTHPSIAVAELMRQLLDEYNFGWDAAWDITTRAIGYTNHTLLPEALEKWPLEMFQSLLPRHMQIIFEINSRFLVMARQKFPNDDAKLARLSIIEESGGKAVRMANLAVIGSKAVNGVAELHSRLLRETTLKDFYDLWPDKFKNITNGVTPRRFIALANPEMSNLINEHIGNEWLTDLYKLKGLEKLADDNNFIIRWQEVKLANKRRLAAVIKERTGVEVDPTSMFDVLVKRIHEYKRQHLKVLDVIATYNKLKAGKGANIAPRTVIIGGKAAPGYRMAKLIIKLINSVAAVINNDPETNDKLKLVFFPNYSVKNGNFIFPAADLSEQISTAGKEASGTGNMKLAMNGALTVGTLDGANIEIREEVGEENFFLFGLTAEQVMQLKGEGYRPQDYLANNHELQQAIMQLTDGTFTQGDYQLFQPIVDTLTNSDEYLVCADFGYYRQCQQYIDSVWADKKRWAAMSITNVARMGKFSSDRAIREYCKDIWNITPRY